MLHYRKNVGGTWKVCSLTPDEAKSIQDKVMKIGLAKTKEIRELAQKHSIEISDPILAVVLSKVVPSYESLANDYIEATIKKELQGPAGQSA